MPWPPRVGEAYPDLRLVDQTGRTTSLSSFKGHVLLVEMIGMTYNPLSRQYRLERDVSVNYLLALRKSA